MASTSGAAAPATTSSAPFSGVPAPDNSNMSFSGASNTTGNNNMTAGSNGFNNRRFAPEPNRRALYVGGLDASVTEDVLKEIFETAVGHVISVKIIPEKGHHKKGKYAFVEFDDPEAAEQAINILNGRQIRDKSVMIINWAYQNSNNAPKTDTAGDCHIFVGDLSNEVNDDILLQAFSAFGTVSEARVMWDMKTGRSRGYGFVSFPNREQAEKAIASMNGEWLGSRAIRCNWANQKGQPSMNQPMQDMHQMQNNHFGQNFNFNHNGGSYDAVVGQSQQWQTTCYVGNLTPYTTREDLIHLFGSFGYVGEVRCQADRGFAFVKMDTHENAAMAIERLNGYAMNGRRLKCSWGKDRSPNPQFDGYNNGPNPNRFPQNNVGFFPSYNGPSGPVSSQGPAPDNQSYQPAGNGFPQGNNQNGMTWAPSNAQNGFGYNPNFVPMN